MLGVLYHETQQPVLIDGLPLKLNHGMNTNENQNKDVGRPIKVNIVGEKFGRLTVISLGELVPRPDGRRRRLWNCRCECGKELRISANQLTSGNTKSCGCLKSDSASERFTKNGSHYNSEYNTWVGMKQRCFNPNNQDWLTYGGRGITVCDQWKHDFQQFLKDVGPRPTKKHTLDRIQTNGNYEPGNVRWATQLEQVNNARSNVMISFQGKTLNFTGWARELGCHKDLIRQRIRAYGWSVEKALTTPIPKPK